LAAKKFRPSFFRHFKKQKSTISSILQKWRQNGTTERRQGSERPSTSTAEEDNMLLNRLRNSPFMTAVEAVNTTEGAIDFRQTYRHGFQQIAPG
jgi:transposase